jgi:hypothetical protein
MHILVRILVIPLLRTSRSKGRKKDMFKKIALVCGVTLVLSVLAVAVAGMGVSAKAASAVVIRGNTCFVFDGNKNVVETTGSVSVVTTGNTSQITCIAKVPPSSTGKVVIYNFSNTGESCETSQSDITGSLPTLQWLEVVTPSGRATLTCHLNRQSPTPTPTP